MSETRCPSPSTWEAFLVGELSMEESKKLVRHLLRGCADCSDELAALSAPLFRQADPRPLPPEIYDFPVELGIRGGLRSTKELRAARAIAEAEVWTIAELGEIPFAAPAENEGADLWWEQAAAWLALARKQRHEDPETALVAAVLAEGCSAKLSPGKYPQGLLGDLRAEIWAEIGNARRLLGQFAEAEEDLSQALDSWRGGLRSTHLLAHLAEVLAAAYSESRRFSEAETLLTRVLSLRPRVDDKFRFGNTLLHLASVAGYRGDNTRAVVLLLDALPLLAKGGDPRAPLFALHNLMGRMVDLGRFTFAEEMLRTLRPHLEPFFGETDRLKLSWVEGKIAAGLERWSVAEHRYRSLRASFASIGMPYYVALVTLDYGALLLRLGRTRELRPLVDEMIATFLGLGIQREALASILLLQNALAAERATLALVEAAVREVQALEGRE
jgi:tetratricopeptide (TPR) repeat protein